MSVRVGFLLLRLFPMYVVVLAADGLRLANKYAGRRVFDWRFLSDRDQAVEASNGIRMDCDDALCSDAPFDYLFVVAGDGQSRMLTPRMRDWLVRASGSKTTLGAIDSGTFALAEARLVRGRRVTVHPMAMPALREQFPDLSIEDRTVVADRSVITCAGGVSTASLVLALARQHCGAEVAAYVGRDMVAEIPTVGTDRASAAGGPAGVPKGLEWLLNVMRHNIESPVSLPRLAALGGLSSRQISRLFHGSFGQSPMDYYRRLRLNHAKQLLLQSDLPIREIAVASGFQSVSAYSRCFKREFGSSPREMLKQLGSIGALQAVPNHHLQRRVTPRND